MPRIVVTNDDGFSSPGLEALRSVAEEIGDAYTVVPRSNHSGASHSLTLRQDLTIERREDRYYIIDGTPTDCARMAYSGWLGFEPEWIISGINKGANLSDDVLYSGTVAAATEGRFLQYAPVAFSLAAAPPYDFDATRAVCRAVLRAVMRRPLPRGVVLNVNVPALSPTSPVKYRLTRLADRTGVARPSELKELRIGATTSIRLPVPPPDINFAEDTDLHAIESGCVSITPLVRHGLSSMNAESGDITAFMEFISSS